MFVIFSQLRIRKINSGEMHSFILQARVVLFNFSPTRDPQLQVCEKYTFLFNLISNISKNIDV